ncbi:MAG: sulfur carrier protein ThiS [Gammaproteobacteria bacterium]|jgi:sulfur carrier protein
MQVVINGEQTTLEGATSVDDLIRLLDIQGKIAVEINGEIVPRSRFGVHDLNEGDRIEIVRAIGGG